MDLLRGPRALQAVHELVSDTASMAAVAIDPGARQSGLVQLLALGNARQAVIIDAAGTPELARLFAVDRPFAAYDGKTVHRALLRTFGVAPSRWACLRVTEQLLLGGRDASLHLDAIALRHDVTPPAAIEGGLVAIGAHVQTLAALLAKQTEMLKAHQLGQVSKIEAGAVAPIAEMEHRGMPFAADAWRQLAVAAEQERTALRKELLLLLAAGGRGDLFGAAQLNLDSDGELLKALQQRGHTLHNVRRSTLALLPAPLGPGLARYRTLSKLVSAYGLNFLDNVGADGRVHPTFEQIGASTGRMACSAPNLQAVVKGSAHRACFRTTAGRVMVTGDYAACELRILAEMSGDPVFTAAFARGEDVHATVAQSMFGEPVSKTVNPQLRQRAKGINFGLCYGMGAAGLARTLNASQDDASALLSRYFKTFPRIRAYLEGAARDALARGYAQTLTGRRLYLSALGADAPRHQAERIAKNMPIQGTNADITKLALALLRRHLPASAWVVNCVHDEIVVECAETDAEAVRVIVHDQMVAAGHGILPNVGLAADVSISTVWDK